MRDQGYDLCSKYNAAQTGQFFNVQPSNALTLPRNFCHGDAKSKYWITVLFACITDGSDKLVPLIIGKRLPAKYKINSNS
jgi:hypothetical protein